MAIAIWKAAYRFNTADGTAPENSQSSPDIAGLSGNRFIVSWTDTSNRYGLGSPDIIGQIAGATGVPVSIELGVSDTYQDGPQVAGRVAALSTGGFVSVYQTEDFAFFTTGQNVSFQRYGAPAGGDPAPYVATRAVGTAPYAGSQGIFQTGEETNPDVTSFADGSFYVVYEDSANNGDVRGVTVSPTGLERTAFVIDSSAEYTSAPQVAALTSGNAVIVYQSLGSTQNVLFRVTGPTGGAALSSGTVAATVSEEIAPAVAALTGGGFVVVWQDSEADGAANSGILARIYSNGGVAAGAAFSVNIDITAGAQSAPAIIGTPGGGFLIAWVDGPSGTIRAREFDSSGVAQGVETVVADVDSLSQPSLTLLSDGRIGLAVTNTDGSSNKDVYVAILDTRGSVIDGSSSADVITSRVAGATVNGLGGGDTLYAMQGDDDMQGGAGDDTFIVDASSAGGTDDFDGGADADTLQVDGGGTVNMTGVTFSNMENLVTTNTAGTRVIISTAQIGAFTGTLDAQGADDTFAVSDLSFLTTFGTPATRAAAFALITDLHAGGVENVEWQEGGATNVAKVIGLNVVITSTDNGANNWATSTYIFDAATGARVSKETTMDDGSIVTRTFGTGPTADILLSDIVTGIVGAVNTTTTTYDTAGRVNNRTVTYDDGRSNHTEYDDSNRVDSRTDTAASGFATTAYYNDSNQRVSLFSDDSASNIYSWTSSTLTLNPANGQVTQKFTVLDNGNEVTENYLNAMITARITEDRGANEAFTRSTQLYVSGVFSHQTTSYDDGTGLIVGSAGANTISSLFGINDAIAGGGGADTFVFGPGRGADRILDFSQAQGDKLDLTALGINEKADITSYTQSGPHLVLDFGNGDSLRINNMTFAALSNADFVA